jgi:hypothetical protein
MEAVVNFLKSLLAEHELETEIANAKAKDSGAIDDKA